MKKYILFVVLTWVGMTLYAVDQIRQGNIIDGHVVVKGTEENVPYATVQVVEQPGKGAVANENGQFQIKGLPEGSYTLKVHAVGYKAQEKKVDVKREYATVVHFFLEEAVFTTDEVVVSANRNEVSRRDAPVVVNVLHTKLFETVNSTDLAKSLSYQSGLRVENNCQNCDFLRFASTDWRGRIHRYLSIAVL